MTILKTENP